MRKDFRGGLSGAVSTCLAKSCQALSAKVAAEIRFMPPAPTGGSDPEISFEPWRMQKNQRHDIETNNPIKC